MTQNTALLQAEVDRLKLEIQTLQVRDGVENIPIGNYLLNRLAQLGVTVRRTILNVFRPSSYYY